jgi:two-component system, OmpR family, phosphate regulon response regulator PhoB
MDDEPRLEGTTILIVEDDPDTRDLLRFYLQPTRATVIEAADGYEALTLVASHRPDMILCDLGLPRLGGISLVERLSRDAGLSRIPVVAITGRGEESDVAEAMATGFSGHMLKPITQSAILSEVRRVVRSHYDV